MKIYDHVVWDLSQPDSTGPHFGPMTCEDAEHWRDRPGFWVQRLPVATPEKDEEPLDTVAGSLLH